MLVNWRTLCLFFPPNDPDVCRALTKSPAFGGSLQHSPHVDSMFKVTATHCTQQHAAARSNTQQHAATRCGTLQHAATHCSTAHAWLLCLLMMQWQHTLQHTLPHIATHCNAHCHTLQHTALLMMEWQHSAICSQSVAFIV